MYVVRGLSNFRFQCWPGFFLQFLILGGIKSTEMWNWAIFSYFHSILSIEKLDFGYWVSNWNQTECPAALLFFLSLTFRFFQFKTTWIQFEYFDLSHEWQKQIDFFIMTIFIQFKWSIMTFEETNWRTLHFGVYFDIAE